MQAATRLDACLAGAQVEGVEVIERDEVIEELGRRAVKALRQLSAASIWTARPSASGSARAADTAAIMSPNAASVRSQKRMRARSMRPPSFGPSGIPRYQPWP